MNGPTLPWGSVNTSHVRIAEILLLAVRANAPSIVLLRKHPSGDASPSEPDVTMTKVLWHRNSVMYSCGPRQLGLVLGSEASEQPGQVGSRELPFEGFGQGFIVSLETRGCWLRARSAKGRRPG